jgi:hypothetical protein
VRGGRLEMDVADVKVPRVWDYPGRRERLARECVE